MRTLSDITINPQTVSTNALLAIITLIVLILSAAVFNATIKENDADIRALIKQFGGPFRAFNRWEDSTLISIFGAAAAPIRSLAPTALALIVAAIIYAFEEPSFGFNTESLVLFLSYLGAFTLLVYAYDGTQLLLSRRYGVSAAIQVFPVGVAIALVCVVLSRITGFLPGLMYGFVAAHVITGGSDLDKEQQGKQVFYPSLVLLAASLVAWASAGPLRNFAESEGTWWASLPEGVAVGLFVAGLQSLFFQLIPIRYMDGHKLMQWNKPAWLALSLTSGFLFWEVFLSADSGAVDALSHTSTIVALSIIAGCLVVTLLVYLAFWLYKPEPVPVEIEAD